MRILRTTDNHWNEVLLRGSNQFQTLDGHYVTYQCFPFVLPAKSPMVNSFPKVATIGMTSRNPAYRPITSELKTHGHFQRVQGGQLTTHGQVRAA